MSDFGKFSRFEPPADQREREQWLLEQEERIARRVVNALGAIVDDSVNEYVNTLTAAGDIGVFDGIPARWGLFVDDYLLDELSGMYLSGGLTAWIIADGDGRIPERVVTGFTQVINQNAVEYALEAKNRMNDVGLTTWNNIKDRVSKAITSGESIEQTTKVLRENVGFSKKRAEMIARTETISAFNNGDWAADQALGEYGPVYKYWMATLDARGRETHIATNRTVKLMAEPFVVGGEELLFPHSPGASAKNVVNCRCNYGKLWPGDPHPVTGEPMPEPDGWIDPTAQIAPDAPRFMSAEPQVLSRPDDIISFGNRFRDQGFTAESFPDDLDAVVDYTNGSGWYSTINSGLRGSYELTKYEKPKFDKYVASLDRLMSAAPKTETPIVTYRGVKQGEFTDLLRTLDIGDEFTDAGFVSTSMNRETANRFARETGTVLEIVTPAGSSGMMPIAFRTEMSERFTTGEVEWLLPRKSRFRVVGRSSDVVKVELMQ